MNEAEAAKADLCEIVDYLMHAAAGVALQGLMSAGDQSVIKDARRTLTEDCARLATFIEDRCLSNSETASYFVTLTRLLEATKSIACRGIHTEPLEKNVQRLAARAANEGSTDKSRLKQDVARLYAHLTVKEALPQINSVLAWMHLAPIKQATLYGYRAKAVDN